MDLDDAYLSPRPPPPTGASSQTNASSLQDRRENKRQSLRLRPAYILENAEPPSPLNQSLRSIPSPKPSTNKMSLFAMFSKPKVERQRGYAEPGFDVAPQLPGGDGNASSNSLAVPGLTIDAPPRPPSAMSVKTTKSSRTKHKQLPPPPPTPPAYPPTTPNKDRNAGSFEPPPLFQAHPQATKTGYLEVSVMPSEAQQKSKARKGSALPVPPSGVAADGGISEDRSSSETKRTSAVKHVSNGNVSNVELPKKLFILITSGILLQYAETGASDRLPEKMLHLHKDSVAYASDLVPGKHHVLLVAQSVNDNAMPVHATGSFFSKMGFRSAASKRLASSFLLVMPSGEDMETWMTAIRGEIDILGGKRVRPDISRSTTGEPASPVIDLKRTPSQSHRYQVKRNPSKVSNIPPSPKPDQLNFPPLSPLYAESVKSEAATIEGIEIEADKLHERNRAAMEPSADSIPEHPTPPPDVEPPAEESAVPTPAGPDLSYLMNHSSHMARAVTAIESMFPSSRVATPMSSTATPPVGQSTPGSVQAHRQGGILAIPAEGQTASSDSSGTPALLSPPPPPPPAKDTPRPLPLNLLPAKSRQSVVDGSPLVGHFPESVSSSPPRHRQLVTTQSEPDLLSKKEKHDSKVSASTLALFQPPLPALDQERSDVVGELALPIALTTSRSLKPSLNPAPTLNNSQQAATYKPRKVASFSVPLRINPSGQNSPPTAGNPRRRSQLNDPDEPAMQTLNAAINGSIAERTHSPETSSLSPPSSRPPSTQFSPDSTPRTYPGSNPHSYSQPNGRPLRRPTSIIITSDQAPFLSSMRTSPETRPAAAPIRSMRPSRSSSTLTSLSQASPPDAFRGLRFDTPTNILPDDLDKRLSFMDRPISPLPLPEEDEEDEVPDLAPRCVSPISYSKSSTPYGSRRSSRRNGSLQSLDFGVPVSGLGPPAPPPRTPLPTPPPSAGSRATSPSPMPHHGVSASVESIAGLGIRVS